MKALILTVVLLVMVASPVYGEWTKEDTGLLLLEIADWAQTRDIATSISINANGIVNTGSDGKPILVYNEINPMLGDHPSIEQVDAYFITCIGINYLVAKCAPEKFHKWWTRFGIVLETYWVTHNLQMGVKFKF